MILFFLDFINKSNCWKESSNNFLNKILSLEHCVWCSFLMSCQHERLSVPGEGQKLWIKWISKKSMTVIVFYLNHLKFFTFVVNWISWRAEQIDGLNSFWKMIEFRSGKKRSGGKNNQFWIWWFDIIDIADDMVIFRANHDIRWNVKFTWKNGKIC